MKEKLVDSLENIETNTEYLQDFILFLIREKYNNLDKKSIHENILVSDIALFFKTFSRNDIQREVNILEGRTDLEFISKNNVKFVLEFKIVRKSAELEKKKNEAKLQLEKYFSSGKYDKALGIIIDLEEISVEILEIK